MYIVYVSYTLYAGTYADAYTGQYFHTLQWQWKK